MKCDLFTKEIINNTRRDIEGKIWERGDWGANPSPGCSLIHDVPGKKVVLDENNKILKTIEKVLFCPQNRQNDLNNDEVTFIQISVVAKEALAQPINA